MRLFGHAGLRGLFTNHRSNSSGNPADDDDDPDNGFGSRRRRRGKASKGRYPAIPSEEGEKLMATGNFGESQHYEDRLRNRKRRLATRLMYRELGTSPYAPNRANKLAAQVSVSKKRRSNILYSCEYCPESHSFVKRRHNNTLQRSVLLWPILR